MPSNIRSLLTYLPFLLILAASSIVAVGQRAAENTGAISGVVVDGATGAPVAGAVVFITPTPVRAVGPQPRQLTDEKGRFVFAQLPGDTSYTIAATRFGYLEGGYGRATQPSDPLRQIPLKTDEWVSNIKVSIWKPGSISGTVRDESGEPVVGVVVRALLRVRLAGRDDFIGGPLTRTDDRGAYRLSQVPPGRYVLQVPSVQAAVPTSAVFSYEQRGGGLPVVPDDVMDVDESQRLVVGRYPVPPPPQNGRQWSYPGVFYPSASVVANATTIELKYGDDRASMDLMLTPVASVRVSGIVEGPPDALRSLTLRLLPAGLENLGFGAEAATALVESDGRFTFLNVPAGVYTIDAPTTLSELSTGDMQIGPRRPLPGPPTTPIQGAQGAGPIDLVPGVSLTSYNFRFSSAPYTGRLSLTVGGSNITGVVFRLRPRATIAGRVVLEPDPARLNETAPPRLQFLLDPAGAEAPLAGPGRSGRGASTDFSFANIIPGQYWLRLQNAGDWVVKSIMYDGRDYANIPLDTVANDNFSGLVVTVTNATPELTGIVRGTADLNADATIVIAFPTEPQTWNNNGFWPARVKSASVSSSNGYRFSNLPAGDYYIAAISRSFADTWREPAFLTRVARTASRVTLAWAAKSRLDINVAVIR